MAWTACRTALQQLFIVDGERLQISNDGRGFKALTDIDFCIEMFGTRWG